MNISQSNLISKIIAYLQIKTDTYKIKRIPEEIVAQLKDGLCFGFSLTLGAMSVIKKSVWWEEVLKAISIWDGEKETLQEMIFYSTGDNPQTLDDIMERFVNYIIFYQANFDLLNNFGIAFDGLNQQSVFYPKKKILSISTLSEEKICESINTGVAHIPIEVETLKAILKELQESLSFCIISGELPNNSSHACCLIFEKNYLYFYDPNYVKGKIAFSLDNILILQELSATIQNVYECENKSVALSCHLISFDNKCSDALIQQSKRIYPGSPKNITVNYLTKIIQFSPTEAVCNLLKSIDYFLTCGIENQFSELFLQDINGWSNLDHLIRHNPKALPEFFCLVEKHEEFQSILKYAFLKTNKDRWNILHELAFNAPEIFPLLFQLVANNKNLQDNFGSALCLKGQKGHSSLYIISTKASVFLEELIDLIKNNKTIKGYFMDALLKNSENGKAPIDIIADNCPNEFIAIQRLLDEKEIDNTIKQSTSDHSFFSRKSGLSSPSTLNNNINITSEKFKQNPL